MQERFKNFTMLIATINRCIHKIKSEEMSRYDLKSSHVSCLYYLYQEDACTATELCVICGEDKANMSRTIKHLENCGYIVCNSPLNKRYQGVFTLTDSGKEIAQYVSERVESLLSVASQGLDESDREIMYRGLALVSTNLTKICDQYDTDVEKTKQEG